MVTRVLAFLNDGEIKVQGTKARVQRESCDWPSMGGKRVVNL